MPHRILVADKDPTSQDTVSRLLSGQDNEFIGVSSSSELKKAIKTQKPDLIILNSVLADVPGWRIVKRIKDSKEYGHVPILLMTGDPGGPPPAKMHTAGADGYLSKPIDGAALKNAVNSLLGVSAGPPAEMDEDITIEFDGDEVAEMTGEVFVEPGALEVGDQSEPATGDTVEIDTGTMAGELDTLGGEDESGYEDTVKLNLDDMDLEDLTEESPALEPTIELVTDISMDADSLDEDITVDTRPDEDETEIREPTLVHPTPDREQLPDFASITQDVAAAARATAETEDLKDSVTVEMDVDDLGLEVDLEETEALPDATIELDADSTDLNQLLDVQEPTMVLTSEDLQLEDDSLGQDTYTTQTIDVIDLEDDSELAEVELEELEPIAVDEDEARSSGLQDADAGPEDLETIELDEAADFGLEIDTGEEAAEGFEEEISVEGLPEEEITTEEFFGHELPTEEFPMDQLPTETTQDLSLEQEISFEEPEFGGERPARRESALGEGAGEAFEVGLSDSGELLIEGGREDEPLLEVTEDILLDEISFEEPAEEAAGAQLKSIPLEEEKIGKLPKTQRRAESAEPLPRVGSSKEPIAPISLAGVKGDAPKGAGPSKAEPRQPGVQARPAFATRDKVVEEVLHRLTGSLPTREEIFGRVDELVRNALPSKKEIERKVDAAIERTLPARESVLSRLDEAIKNIPSQESILKRLDEVRQALPSPGEITATLESAVKAIPSRQEFDQRVQEALRALPSTKTVGEAVEKALRAVLPPEEVVFRLEQALGEFPSADSVYQRLDQAIEAAVPRHEVQRCVDEALRALSSVQALKERFEGALEALPSREYIHERVTEALESFPTPEAVTAQIEEMLGAMPTREEVEQRLDRAIEAVPDREALLNYIDQGLKMMPTSEDVLTRLDGRVQSIMPTRGQVENALTSMVEAKVESAMEQADLPGSIAAAIPTPEDFLDGFKEAIPDRDRFQETIAQGINLAIENALPEKLWLESLSRGLFDERTRGLLPSKDEVAGILREEIRYRLLETVEKIVRAQLERISAELKI